MKEVPMIEGLRAYLALWVVADHLLAVCGYGLSGLTGLLYILRSGWYAVDLFIIISGFVIFFLLDNKKENYTHFITRRFFRIWPLFIFLFIISIPLSKIYIWNINEFSFLFDNRIIGDGIAIERINSWWDNVLMHIAFHLPMLHGIIPNNILPHSPGSFLGPAWSISLEWQFYLIAPLFFILIKKYKSVGLNLIILICVILFSWGININNIDFGAFLPMHIEFFLLGICSYFLYKYFINNKILLRYNIIIIFSITLLIFYNLNFEIRFLPYFIWLNFFCLLIDYVNGSERSFIRKVGFIFHNGIIRYIGRISYSIYLSHFLVLITMQFFLLKIFPLLSLREHFLLLSVMTILVTIGISIILYNFIELYFTKKGNKIVKVFSRFNK